MNKALLTILVIALLGVAGWFIFGNKDTGDIAPAPEVDDTSFTTQETDTTTSAATTTKENATGTSSESSTADVQTFDVSGTNFAFDVTEIRVKEGDTVTIHFTAAEGFHDWVVDEFDAATEQVRPGTPTSVTFVADAAGTYEYYCSVGNHRAMGMVGTLIVEAE